MDALEYLKEKSRMTKKCNIGCDDCKLSSDNNGKDISCSGFEDEFPEQAIQIVEDWSKENQIVTNKDKYLEVMNEIFGFECEKVFCNVHEFPESLCSKFNNCDKCKQFWYSEYKPVKEDV